ncbi:MAG: pseudouridine synthase [Eubacteriaceae bacterium]|jgi:pseudouridine synthase
MRLQKYIAHCGVTSRRKAETMILDGRVRVNGETVNRLGTEIKPGDVVEVDGSRIEPEEKRYVLLNKPAGYVCTSEDAHAEKTVHDLIDGQERLYTAGRLDKDTEGLILLTNDGELTNKLTHPSHTIDKTYEAMVQGVPAEEELKKLRTGVMILEDDENSRTVRTAPAAVRIMADLGNAALLEITIHEGRKRQVRKMCAAIGHPVKKLRRVREGCLDLKGLKPGDYRELTREEVSALKKEAGK